MDRRRSKRLQPQIHTTEEYAGMDRRRSKRLQPQIHMTEEDAGMDRRCSKRLQPQIHTTEEDAGMDRRRSTRLQPQIHNSAESIVMDRRRSPRLRPEIHASEPAPLPDDDDMLREILLRLPPQPSSLPRAAAVCRRWRGLVADPRFLRQLCAHHLNPPLLGVFSRRNRGPGVAFSPVLGPPDRVPLQRLSLGLCGRRAGYDLVDCRHGLVLLKNRSRTEFIVCDPVTGQQRRVPVPPEHKTQFFNGAVLCAAGDRSSPFKLVFISGYNTYHQPLAHVYSSETGMWGDRILTHAPCEVSRKPAVLVGDCLYWMSMGDDILEFHTGQHTLTVIRGPPLTDRILFRNRQIIQADDGAVGYAIVSYPHFEMWQRNITDHDVATWVLCKTIQIHTMLRLPSTHQEMYVQLLGYDEDDVLFLSYGQSVYTVQLKSMQSSKLDEFCSTGNRYFPFKTFLTPAPGAAIAGGFNGAEMLHMG